MQVPQHYVRRQPLGPLEQLRTEPLAWPVFRLANMTELCCGGGGAHFAGEEQASECTRRSDCGSGFGEISPAQEKKASSKKDDP